MNKKIIPLLASILVFIIIVFGGFFYYQNSGKTNIQKDHERYLTLINDNHDFDEGVKGLESLDNEKGQNVFKNIKTEIKIAKELKNADSSLDNKDIDSAKKSLEKVDTLTIDNSFDKAIDRLKEDITNYEKALKEIKDTKADDTSSILDKYKFNHNALKVKLSENKSTKENTNTTKSSEDNKTQEVKDVKTGLTFDVALEKNFNYYYNTIVNDIKNDISQKFGATLINATPNGRDSDGDGITIAVQGSNIEASGTYTLKYYQNTKICKLIRGIDQDIKTYPAIYNM